MQHKFYVIEVQSAPKLKLADEQKNDSSKIVRPERFRQGMALEPFQPTFHNRTQYTATKSRQSIKKRVSN
jgi:triphosphoribosyl-dephospho-CoA synthetase